MLILPAGKSGAQHPAHRWRDQAGTPTTNGVVPDIRRGRRRGLYRIPLALTQRWCWCRRHTCAAWPAPVRIGSPVHSSCASGQGEGESGSIWHEADWRHRAPLADTRCGIMAPCMTSVIMARADRFVHAVPAVMEDAPARMHTRQPWRCHKPTMTRGPRGAGIQLCRVLQSGADQSRCALCTDDRSGSHTSRRGMDSLCSRCLFRIQSWQSVNRMQGFGVAGIGAPAASAAVWSPQPFGSFTCSWLWITRLDASSMSMSQHTPRRTGRCMSTGLKNRWRDVVNDISADHTSLTSVAHPQSSTYENWRQIAPRSF